MTRKKYSGIVGDKEQVIRKIIMEGKTKSDSYRKIGDAITSKTGVVASHSTVRAYWVDVMDGNSLDVVIERTSEETRKGDDIEIVSAYVDEDMMQAVIDKHEKRGTIGTIEYNIDRLKVLINSNIDAMIEGREVLRPQYTELLRKLKNINKEP